MSSGFGDIASVEAVPAVLDRRLLESLGVFGRVGETIGGAGTDGDDGTGEVTDFRGVLGVVGLDFGVLGADC